MNKADLLKIKAGLESKIDVLETELSKLNELLEKCGFPEGLRTLKEALLKIFMEESEE